jgi:hypothetical protein
MKIVDRKTFLALSPNTVFSKYEPCVFDPIAIKLDTLEGGNDFFVNDSLHDGIECQSCDDEQYKLDAAQQGMSIPLTFNIIGRDGFYDEDQLFAVWEPDDIRGLIARLTECLPKEDAK